MPQRHCGNTQHCNTWAVGALQNEQKGLTNMRRNPNKINVQSLQTEPRNKEGKCKTAPTHVNNVSYWHNLFFLMKYKQQRSSRIHSIKICVPHYALSKHGISRNSKSYIKSAVTSASQWYGAGREKNTDDKIRVSNFEYNRSRRIYLFH